MSAQSARIHPCCSAQVLICLFCCLAVLCAGTRPCRAQSPADAADNQTLHIRFISLKPGSTIGASHLCLRGDGGINFSIEHEKLLTACGTWKTQDHGFSASVDFTVDKLTAFHYRLLLEGYRVMGLHAGRARLLEYDRQKRLTQEIGFLFYAEPPGIRKSAQPADAAERPKAPGLFTAQFHAREVEWR